MPSGLGTHWEIPKSPVALERLLFGEGGSRVLISISPQNVSEWNKFLDRFNSNKEIPVLATKIGKVTSDLKFLITQGANKIVNLPISKMIDSFEDSIPRRVGAFND